MIRRPLHHQFAPAVLHGIKDHTIREKPWPLQTPTMLYSWTGKPYNSPQREICAIIVQQIIPVTIHRLSVSDRILVVPDDSTQTEPEDLWKREGFPTEDAFQHYFRQLIKPGREIERHLHHFTLYPAYVLALPDTRGRYTYVTQGDGDPPRTYDLTHATRHLTREHAEIARLKARDLTPTKIRTIEICHATPTKPGKPLPKWQP